MTTRCHKRWPLVSLPVLILVASVAQPLYADTDGESGDDATASTAERIERLRAAIEREREALEREREARRSMTDRLDRMRDELEHAREAVKQLESEIPADEAGGD